MARQKKKTVLGTVVAVLVVVALVWMKIQETRDERVREGTLREGSVEIPKPQAKDVAEIGKLLTGVRVTSSRFEVIGDCELIDSRGNDGDSFLIRTPSGDREEVRLYFVDAPESAAREYGNGDTNYKRIADQGKVLGGLNRDQTTQVGVEAKLFVKELLTGKKFRVATIRESVYRSRRIYAFVMVTYEGEERYLHELLVMRGLARIHTKPMTLPDNTSGSRQRDRLRKLEQFAKSKNYGAWGIR